MRIAWWKVDFEFVRILVFLPFATMYLSRDLPVNTNGCLQRRHSATRKIFRRIALQTPSLNFGCPIFKVHSPSLHKHTARTPTHLNHLGLTKPLSLPSPAHRPKVPPKEISLQIIVSNLAGLLSQPKIGDSFNGSATSTNEQSQLQIGYIALQTPPTYPRLRALVYIQNP